MAIRNPVRRRVARDLARLGAACSAVAIFATLWNVGTGVPGASAAAVAGSATVIGAGNNPDKPNPVTTAGSATEFTLQLPVQSKCSGDSTSDNYRWSTYLVPSSVDPATLTFQNPPILPAGASGFAANLYEAGGSAVRNKLTAPKDPGGAGGLIVSVPAMKMSIYTAAQVAGNTFNVGIACFVGDPGPTQLDKFWNAQVTFTADANDAQGFTWAVAEGGGTTTTDESTSTTADPGSTSTTADPGGSTTTIATSTTLGDGSTTTTAKTAVLGESTSPISGTPTVTTALPRTGSSTAALVFWSVLLLVFGRMAILLGRTPKVIPVKG